MAKGGHISRVTTLTVSFWEAPKACSNNVVAASVVRCSTTSSTVEVLAIAQDADVVMPGVKTLFINHQVSQGTGLIAAALC